MKGQLRTPPVRNQTRPQLRLLPHPRIDSYASCEGREQGRPEVIPECVQRPRLVPALPQEAAVPSISYVYIAAPYSGGDPVDNTREVVLVADRLAAQGHAVYVPHLSLFWHFLSPHAIDFWYDHDLAWLAKCDVLLRLPGESPGADAEVAFARERGIRVCFSEDDIGRSR